MSKSFCLLVLLFFAAVSLAHAQDASATDEIVIKAANAVLFQMKANLNLTDDQLNAVRPIVTDNIVKDRDLEQSLKDGNIDSAAMVQQRRELLEKENNQLSSILSEAQLKTWKDIEMQQGW